MADGIILQTRGFEIFDAQLKHLERKVAKQIVKTATRTAAKNTLKEVKANAKSLVGGEMGTLLAKHAKIIVFKHQRRGSWGVQIGMKAGIPEFTEYSKIGKRNYIPSAIEFGHGNARPIPFIRSAWAKTKAQDVRIMGKELKKGIEREAKRGR